MLWKILTVIATVIGALIGLKQTGVLDSAKTDVAPISVSTEQK